MCKKLKSENKNTIMKLQAWNTTAKDVAAKSLWAGSMACGSSHGGWFCFSPVFVPFHFDEDFLLSASRW